MSWLLDIVLAILVGGSALGAFRKGMTREIIGFATAIAALVLGCWFYGSVGGYIMQYVASRTVANLLGFVAVFCLVLALGGLLGRAASSMTKVVGLSFLDRLMGAAFGFARGMLLAIALVMALMAFSSDGKAPRAVVHSRLCPYVLRAAHVCSTMAPYELKHSFSTSYDEIKVIWGEALDEGMRALPSKKKGKE